MDIGFTRQAALGRPGALQSQISYFLGIVWFHVLLTNASQPAVTIIAALAEFLEKNQENVTGTTAASLFAIENVFWNPAAHHLKEIPPAWKELWEKTLELAWNLLTVNRSEYMNSYDKFRQDLSAIRKEIKKHLFVEKGTPAIASSDVPSDVSDDCTIHEILTDIIAKWESSLNPSHTETSGPKDIQSETVLLIRDSSDEILQETVMVTKDEFEGELEKTVVLSNVKTEAAFVETPVPTQEKTGDEPCETIILSGKTTSKPFDPKVSAPEVENTRAVDEDDILSETIILRLPKK